MGDHYFSQRPSARGPARVFSVTLRGEALRIMTMPGVFSRRQVDPGTRLLIEHMEVRPADEFLDLGCGYGVVGLVAARLASRGRVVMVDINERALALARANIEANGLANAEALAGDGFAPVAGRVFDVIALNPPVRAGTSVVHRLIEGAVEHLRPGGRFYLVGRTRQGAVRLSEKMRQSFGNAEEIAKGGGYRLYLSRRPLS